jgi:putative transposase
VDPIFRTVVVKYEDIYLKGYGDMCGLTLGLTEYFAFYNRERPHQSLGNMTPDRVYNSAEGGGAMIMDKYPRKSDTVSGEETGQRCSAADEVVQTA